MELLAGGALLRLLPDALILQAADLDTAEALLLAEQPALALLDLHMPGMQGVQGVRRLQRLAPALKLVVVSGDDDPAVMRAAFAAGAAAPTCPARRWPTCAPVRLHPARTLRR